MPGNKEGAIDTKGVEGDRTATKKTGTVWKISIWIAAMQDLVIESTTANIGTSTGIDIDTVKNTLTAAAAHIGKPKQPGRNDEPKLIPRSRSLRDI